MKKFVEFVITRSFTVMLAGMIVAVIGVLCYMYFSSMRYRFTPLPNVAMVLAIIGFVTYFIGRIALVTQRKHATHRPASDEDKTE